MSLEKFPEETELDEANEPHESLKIVQRDRQKMSEWREKTKKQLRKRYTKIKEKTPEGAKQAELEFLVEEVLETLE